VYCTLCSAQLVYRGTNTTASIVASVGISGSQVISVVQAAFTGVTRGANAYRGTVFGVYCRYRPLSLPCTTVVTVAVHVVSLSRCQADQRCSVSRERRACAVTT
jgi:hypothetical protein